MTPGNRRVGLERSLVDIDGTPNLVPVPSAPPPPSRVLSVLRTAMGIALVAGVSVGAAWALRRHVMTSSRFALAEVDVVGNETRPTQAVVAESGLAIGVNIFAADLDAARARILADPWVSEASLMRRLPRTISIVVTERKAAALVVLGDTYLASADGEPFKKIEVNDPIDLPVITGLRPETLADDRLETIRTIRRAVDLALEFEHGELAKHAPLQEVHVAPDGTFTLVVGHAALQLVLGVPPFRRKLVQAARIVAELDRRGASAGAIMLDNDARPERVVVRIR
jgi:cell division protein FtsQ